MQVFAEVVVHHPAHAEELAEVIQGGVPRTARRHRVTPGQRLAIHVDHLTDPGRVQLVTHPAHHAVGGGIDHRLDHALHQRRLTLGVQADPRGRSRRLVLGLTEQGIAAGTDHGTDLHIQCIHVRQQAVDGRRFTFVFADDAVEFGKVRGHGIIRRCRCIRRRLRLAQQTAEALLELVHAAFHRHAFGGQLAFFGLQVGFPGNRHQQLFQRRGGTGNHPQHIGGLGHAGDRHKVDVGEQRVPLALVILEVQAAHVGGQAHHVLLVGLFMAQHPLLFGQGAGLVQAAEQERLAIALGGKETTQRLTQRLAALAAEH